MNEVKCNERMVNWEEGGSFWHGMRILVAMCVPDSALCDKMGLNDVMSSLTSNSKQFNCSTYSIFLQYSHTSIPDSSLHRQMGVYHMAVSLPSSRSHT